jgi:cell division protein FtsW (lipid II flippase)
MTAGVFSDLGGSLISATILWALLVLLFGPSVGLGALGIGALLAFIALQTDKVAGRLELMLNPMSALISDFARLEKFRSAASDVGYHLGQVQWCSFEGSCLPLQSLSDYMPILLVSTLGFWPSVAVTGLVGSFYIVLMIVSINGIGRYPGSIRVIYSFAFFLLLASLTQALLTILGSFRLIPLTGLGLPMFSLGISSLLSAILAPTFIGIASALTKQQETPA